MFAPIISFMQINFAAIDVQLNEKPLRFPKHQRFRFNSQLFSGRFKKFYHEKPLRFPKPLRFRFNSQLFSGRGGSKKLTTT
jgi:hypothetical protein